MLASWGYNITIHPLLLELQQIVDEEFLGEGSIMFYVDDGNLIAPHHVMLRLLQHLLHAGPTYGYKIKKNKGHYCIGHCDTMAEAQERWNNLRDLGFQEDIISLHPDNVEDQSPEGRLESQKKYGIKILGSFVGHFEFVRTQLQEYLDNLRKVADKLRSYPDLQGRMLLFRYCFCKKPYHLLRTIPPTTMFSFIRDFEDMKADMLKEFMGIPDAENLPEAVFDMCCLPIQQGGLDIQCLYEVAMAAYSASMAAFLRSSEEDVTILMRQEIDTYEGGGQLFDRNDDSHVYHIQQFKLAVSVLNTEQKAFREAVNEILQLEDSPNHSVQSQLTARLTERRMQTMEENMLLTSLKWWMSLRCDTAGKWLEAIPKMAKFRLSSEAFRTALCYRYLLPIPNLVAGSRCMCKRKPALDSTGHHLATGCGLHNTRKQNHDALVIELDDILSYAGFWTKREELGCFQMADPDDNKRPDISVLNPVNCKHPKLVLDVSVTSPLEGAEKGILRPPKSRRRALIKDAAANTRFQQKKQLYGACAEASGLGFLPIIFESTGRLHEQGKRFLKAVAKKASAVKKIRADVLYRFFLKRLSCCLYRGLGESINLRVLRTNSHQPFFFEKHWQDPIVIKHEYVAE